MTSKPDLQAITIHILPNISQIKSNSTMEIGQLIEYNKRNIFLQKPRLLFNFLKSFVRGESKWSAVLF